MNCSVIVDWKSIAALGGSIATIFLLWKLDASAVERVSIHVIDAAKEAATARNSGC